jgi:AcrR family transcriptional regulator
MEIKERIIESAAELFRMYGIKAVTMDSLATYLGISKRTIYEVFADKDELLIGVLKWMAEKQSKLVTRVLQESENAIVAIFKLLEINWNHFQQMSPSFPEDLKRYYHKVLMKKLNQHEMPGYRDHIEVIERGINENLFRKDINPDLVSRCLHSLLKSTIDQNLYPYEEFSRVEVVKNVFINYMRGIATTNGLELINKLDPVF